MIDPSIKQPNDV